MSEKKTVKSTAKKKPSAVFTDDYKKSLFEKRKYYSEHPEQAKINVGKKFDGH